jgi:hypothetical protein
LYSAGAHRSGPKISISGGIDPRTLDFEAISPRLGPYYSDPMKYPAEIEFPEPEYQEPNRERQVAVARERERVRFWHATYNAAVQGSLAHGSLSNEAIEIARHVADETHGVP